MYDLGILAKVFRESWLEIRDNCAVQRADLDKAAALQPAILRLLVARQQGNAATAEVSDIRRRAFTLVCRAYDEVRRGVIYLRWHEGDADKIIPSLYKMRVGRQRVMGKVTAGKARSKQS